MKAKTKAVQPQPDYSLDDFVWYTMWQEDESDKNYCYEVIVAEIHFTGRVAWCGSIMETTGTPVYSFRVLKGSREQCLIRQTLKEVARQHNDELNSNDAPGRPNTVETLTNKEKLK